jgi:cyclopropane-fatty-acyl-phospholipid synthase
MNPILSTFLKSRPHGVTLELWDGTVLPSLGDEKLRLRIGSLGTLCRTILSPSPLVLGEAFVHGKLDVVGEVEEAFEALKSSKFRRPGIARSLVNRAVNATARFRSAPGRCDLSGRRGSRSRVRKGIAFHYNLPVEFWSKWLDPTLAYSCAYFADATQSLAQAQERKYEYICRKLCLQEGERLLDLGCGWGGLAIYAAKTYGAQVVGVTLSESQADHARRRISDLGLESRCTIELKDIRDFSSAEKFDKVSSVGAVEHFGFGMLDEFFATAWQALKDSGLFLCHGITSVETESGRDQHSFTHQYLFPDFQLSTVSDLLHHAERTGFEVRDVESLRQHYILTFLAWRQRLLAEREAIIALVGDVTYRVFLLSLNFMLYAHRTGKNNLHQMLFSKSSDGTVKLSLTRDSWYRERV